MGPGIFVIAILGCADGGSSCTAVATLPTRYATAAQCSAAAGPALEQNNDFEFPTRVASCRAGAASASAQVNPESRTRGVARGD
jgi:hypothetical protein